MMQGVSPYPMYGVNWTPIRGKVRCHKIKTLIRLYVNINPLRWNDVCRTAASGFFARWLSKTMETFLWLVSVPTTPRGFLASWQVRILRTSLGPRCNRQVYRLYTFNPNDFVCRFLLSSPGRRERRRDLKGIYICINETVVVEILVVLLGLPETTGHAAMPLPHRRNLPASRRTRTKKSHILTQS